MPIKWSAVRVSQAMDEVESQVTLAKAFLEEAKTRVEEARRIANLPQYVDQGLVRIIGEIERAIGGSHLEPVGRLKAGIESVRKSIPDGAKEAEQERLNHGSTQSML